MNGRIALLLTGMLVALIVSMPSMVSAATPLRLIAMPAQGHVGNPVFLSGSGFPARRLVSIFLKCDSRSPARVAGTRANALGRFVGVRVVPTMPKLAGRCAFSAAAQAAPGRRTRASAYTFVASGRPLATCSVHMCLHVQAFLVRLRNGARGNIIISGWPGATADVTVARTQAGAKYREVRLNWKGVGSVTTRIAPGLLKGLQARVFVRAHFGRIRGQTVTPFHVMFGNR